ncbi:SDR family NAD(P)-dependent oxidoreductase [Saccharomonospora halophila]|uniref:SDR family NAD(P)-dependent oxidoreductase n=1 Tax=Saccharomonospora halophila TaxID=129922 RepID=UPI00048DD1FC|nr:SDR family oxidoreductase [Saccharomonospora halophila]
MTSTTATLVTGGSRGIGAATARRLARDGHHVAITYTSSPDRARALVSELERSGVKALAVEADSADAEALTAAVDAAAAEFGGLDILVNNAGVFPTGSVDALDVDTIDHTLAVHVRAVLVATRAAVRHMRPGGRIISIGSNLATRVPGDGITLYAASKAALIGLTRGLARDLGGLGITANVVAPGSTDTDMNPAGSPDADAQRTLTALGRYNDPEDIAAAVAYLAGAGGRNVTGTTLLVDAGANA